MTETITAILETITSVIAPYGILGIGWIVSIGLFLVFIKAWASERKKSEASTETLEKVRGEYIEELKGMNDELQILNDKHNEIVNEISEKRIEDLKELTNDYNNLASSTISTLDRLVKVLENKNIKSKTKSSEEK